MSSLADLHLRLHPPSRNRSLRAWDAADELVLDDVHDALAGATVLVVNDRHGALALGARVAGAVDVTSWSDSAGAHQSSRLNAAANDVAPPHVLASTEAPASAAGWDVVIIKVPKTLALLDDQLCRLRPYVSDASLIVGAGMVRHIHTSTLERFVERLGPTTTSLAKKKARLIRPVLDEATRGATPATGTHRTEENGVHLVEYANVFARGKLDIGTRLLLDHLPTPHDGADVIDLGCGNGILGLTLARCFDGGSVRFVDQSYHAVASAEAGWRANDLHRRQGVAAFQVSDALEDSAAECADLIVCNPPFHDDHRVGDDTAWRMFSQAHRVLRPGGEQVGGELWVVANRHLGHHTRLSTLFGSVETAASNAKFVVLRSART